MNGKLETVQHMQKLQNHAPKTQINRTFNIKSKCIQSNRGSDKIAVKLTKKKPANFDKDLHPNPVVARIARTIVWYRDIVAAKCIMHKGRNDGWENT